MIRRVWRRIGPWATPTLVLVEVFLVWIGPLSLRAAVISGVVIEALLWVTAISRVLAGVRRFRSGREAGLNGWAAAEDGLAQLVPRPVARALLFEPRLWACMVRWITGRYEAKAAASASYGYHDCVRVLIWVAFGLALVEGFMLNIVLAFVLPRSPWVWVSTGVHVYALLLIVGFYASLITRPHMLDREVLRLRESIFTELVIPYGAIRQVLMTKRPDLSRSWFKINEEKGIATLAYGDANVALTLDTTMSIEINRLPSPTTPAELFITADRPREFVNALTDALRARVREPEVGE